MVKKINGYKWLIIFLTTNKDSKVMIAYLFCTFLIVAVFGLMAIGGMILDNITNKG